jgi:hypothetical protein
MSREGCPTAALPSSTFDGGSGALEPPDQTEARRPASACSTRACPDRRCIDTNVHVDRPVPATELTGHRARRRSRRRSGSQGRSSTATGTTTALLQGEESEGQSHGLGGAANGGSHGVDHDDEHFPESVAPVAKAAARGGGFGVELASAFKVLRPRPCRCRAGGGRRRDWSRCCWSCRPRRGARFRRRTRGRCNRRSRLSCRSRANSRCRR